MSDRYENVCRWTPRNRVAVAACLLLACASPRPATLVHLERTAGPATAPPTDLVAAMARLTNQLKAAGVAPVPGLSFHGFIATGGRRVQAVNLPADTCMTLAALSTEGLGDLDAALYTAAGEALATDAQPDAHPAIQVCGGPTASRLYYVATAYEGAGSFLMRAFAGPRAAFAAVAQRLGGQPALAPTPGRPPAASDHIDALSASLRDRGFQPLGPPLRVPLDTRQRVRIGLRVGAGQCYAVAAVGLSGLPAVDLRILDQEDRELVRDASPAARAQVQFCAYGDAWFSAEASAPREAGAAAVRLYRGSAQDVQPRAGLWMDGPEDAAREAPGIESGQGGGVARRLQGHLDPGQVLELPIALDGPGCYRLDARGGNTVRRLRAEWVVTTAGAPRPDPELCVDETGHSRVRLRAEGGYGRFALTIRRVSAQARP